MTDLRPRLANCVIRELVQCFSVDGIPDQVTQNQVVSLTWHWGTTDPTRVMIAHTFPNEDVAGIITPSVTVDTTTTQGVLTFTFPDGGKTKSMVAYDLDRVEYNSLVKVAQPRPYTSNYRPCPWFIPTSNNQLDLGSNYTAYHGVAILRRTSSTPDSTISAAQSTTPIAITRGSNRDSGSATAGPTTFEAGNMPHEGDTAGPESGKSTPLSSAPPQSDESPQSRPPPAKRQDIATIIGATIGSLASIILILFFIFCRRRQGKHGRSLLPEKPEAFHGEKMIKKRAENPLQQRDTAHRRDSYPEASLTTTFVLRSPRCFDDNGSASSSISASERISEATFESSDYTSYTISETESEADVISTIKSTSTEITHEYITPRTDRQMEIERKIFELQSQMIRLSDRSGSSEIDSPTPMSMDPEIIKLRERIVRLEELRGEGWAMELTEEVPLEMLY
ncbi:hypothetical protein AAF712_010280 [Marasmius tenuissimus]|uniref:Uncharacterized protein n=1 Tax=Marasmius tenuissimus TaxID=585030 RepID=A0ABR2ZMD7_9AGAR